MGFDVEPVVSLSGALVYPSATGLPVAGSLVLVDSLDTELSGVLDEPGQDLVLDDGDAWAAVTFAVAKIDRSSERMGRP